MERILLLITALLWIYPANAQRLLPIEEEGSPFFFANYHSREYGLHFQNWDVVTGPDGVVYFANTGGVLTFDGATWSATTLPAAADPAVRSLAFDEGGHLFVGGVGEVGYLAPDSLDRYQYVSLLSELPEAHRRFGDVWTTHATSDGIYFQSFGQIIRWSAGTVRVWTTPNRYHKAFSVNGDYYVREEDVGLLRVEGDQLVPIPGGDVFAEISVFGLVPHPRGLLAITRSEGLFLLNEAGSEPFSAGVTTYLSEYRPYDALLLDRRLGDRMLYALSTLGGGVVIMDQDGALLQVYREEVGLSVDDFVLGLGEDHQGGVWMALDNGIGRVDVLGPLTRFDLQRDLEGIVYDVVRHRGDLYAAATTGLYRLMPGRARRPAHGGQFEGVDEIRGQTWDLLSTEHGLLVATNDGIVIWNNGRRQMLAVGQAFQLFQSRIDPQRVYAGMKDGIAVLDLAESGWVAGDWIPGINEEIRAIEEDDAGALWVMSPSSGVLRLDVRNERDIPSVTRFETVNGAPLGSVILDRIDGRLVLLAESGNYYVDGTNGEPALLRDPALDVAISGESGFVAELSDQLLVVESERQLHIYRVSDGGFTDVTPPVLRSGEYRVISAQSDQDGVLWIGTEDGLLRYDPRLEKHYEAPYPALIRSVRDRHRDLLFGEARSSYRADLELSHKENALRFTFAAPSFNAPGRTQYQYRLDGFDEEWSAWSYEEYTEYTNLPEFGDYRFRVRAINAQGVISEEDIFAFSVLPPWYRTWWAYVGYVLLFGGLMWSISAWRLRAHRRELEDERMVNQRLERMNARLAETNERLRQADKLKDDLLANTSHELRTPLTAILGFSSVLAEEGNEEQQELASSIHRSGQRLLDTVNSLLDMAKLQANMMELRPVELDVAEVTADVLAMVKPLADDRGIYLKLLPEGLEIPTVSDRYGLERILINLVSNAIKFTETGGITVLIDGDRSDIVLTVRDTGIGMKPSFLPNLFDAFTQASSGYARSHEGSGLGLAIVKRVVDLMGGEISVESEPGRGTTFTVVLPRMVRRSGGASHLPALSVTGPRVSEPVLQGAQLLIVEPDVEEHAVIHEALSAYATIILVDTVSEALREARATPYDAVLVAEPLDDPDEERRAVRAIRSLPGYARTPMALLADQRADPGRNEKLGYDQVLVKPVHPEALRRLVEDLLTHADRMTAEVA